MRDVCPVCGNDRQRPARRVLERPETFRRQGLAVAVPVGARVCWTHRSVEQTADTVAAMRRFTDGLDYGNGPAWARTKSEARTGSATESR